MPKTEEKPQQEISFLDLILVISNRIKFILVFSIITTGLFILSQLIFKILPPDSPFNLMPDYYEPSTIIRLQEFSQSSDTSGLSSSNSLTALLAGGTLSSGNDLVETAQTLIKTNSFLDEVIKENDLATKEIKGFEGLAEIKQKQLLIDLRAKISTNIKFEYEATNDMITLKFQYREAQAALDILKSVQMLLGKRLVEISKRESKNKKTYLAEKLTNAAIESEKATQALIEFQQNNQDFTGSESTQSTVARLLSLENTIITKQQKMDLLKTFSAPNSPELTLLQTEINSLLGMKATEQARLSGGNSSQLAQNFDYLKLKSNVELTQSLMSLYQGEYAKAEIEENLQDATFTVIEEPELLILKSGPGRGKMVMIAGVAFFFLSIFLAFIKDYLSKTGSDPQDSQKMQEIKHNFKHIFRKK